MSNLQSHLNVSVYAGAAARIRFTDNFRTFSQAAVALAMLVLLLCGFVATSHADLLLYEGFDYTAGTDLAGQGDAGQGFSGTWSTGATTGSHPATDGIDVLNANPGGNGWSSWDGAFTSVTRTGNWVGGADGNTDHNYFARGLGSNVTDAIANGTTLWVSFIGNGRTKIALGDDPLDHDRGRNIRNDTAAIGGGSRHNDTGNEAMWWQAASGDPTVSSGSTGNANERLVVLKLEWNNGGSGEDTITANWFADGTSPTEASFNTDHGGSESLLAAFDESTIDTLSLAANRSSFDEIRIGTTFEDIITGTIVAGAAAVPEPCSLALAFLGLISLGFVGWRRRRR